MLHEYISHGPFTHLTTGDCFSGGQMAAGVIVTPLLLSLVVGGIVTVVVIIWKKQLIKRFSLWRKTRLAFNYILYLDLHPCPVGYKHNINIMSFSTSDVCIHEL